MRTAVGTSPSFTSWRHNPIRTRHLADLEDVCFFLAIGLCLTGLFCVLGHPDSFGQALALAG